MTTNITRKQFIEKSGAILVLASSSVLLSSLFSCKRGYTRAAAELKLGAVQDLFYNQQLVRDRDILVNRDDGGWSALSAQCTYDGCALSYQEERFLCTCCGSVYDHSGGVLKGPSEYPLPNFAMRYSEGILFADSGQIVSSTYRFMSPELQQAIDRLADRIKKEGTRAGSQIPEILLGKGDQTETGPMFEEKKLPPKEISSENVEPSDEAAEQ